MITNYFGSTFRTVHILGLKEEYPIHMALSGSRWENVNKVTIPMSDLGAGTGRVTHIQVRVVDKSIQSTRLAQGVQHNPDDAITFGIGKFTMDTFWFE